MRQLLVILSIALLILVSGCSKPTDTQEPKKQITLETERQKESYSAGFRAGIHLYSLLKSNDIELDIAMEGVRDAVNASPKLPNPEMQKIYSQFQNRLKKRQEEEHNAQLLRNKKLGEDFLKENATKEGVIVTKSGLQYKILKEGIGSIPKEGDIAIVHYRGTRIDGKEVFNTYQQGQPIKLPVHLSLPAWKEALQLMKTGSKFILYIPPDLAYKEHGKPPLIDPHTVLIYEAELVGIE